SLLVRSIIEKELAIRTRNQQIDTAIASELLFNQRGDAFSYAEPTLKEAANVGRLDAAIYSKELKLLLWPIVNYRHGWGDYDELGFDVGRGQNLQVSSIGNSVYSDILFPGMYRLMAPTDMSEFRTVRQFRYLGNKKSLALVKKGDVVFGAEGFCK